MAFLLRARAQRLDRDTPEDRDRYADFLRTTSLGLVVLGHWLVAVIFVRDGELVAERLLTLEPATQWLTWLFQVMPIFFLIGGFANARSWSLASERSQAWAGWMHERARRLLSPLAPLLAFWILFVVLLLALGWPGKVVQVASQTAFAPLWFLGTYVLVVALVPWTWALHRRLKGWDVAAFVVAAASVDGLRRAGIPFVEFANLWFVWAGIHQCGYYWTKARLVRRPMLGLGMLVLGLAAMGALIVLGGYPISMVTLGGDQPNNAGPPTVVLFALLAAQAGLIVALRPLMDGWLQRPIPWASVVFLGRYTLTIFLWHVTALIVAAALIHGTGLWRPTQIDEIWWWSRVPWLLLCAIILSGIVAAAGRLEGAAVVGTASAWRMTVGLVAVLGGITWINRRGLYTTEDPAVSAIAAILLVAGLVTLRVVPTAPRVRRTSVPR